MTPERWQQIETLVSAALERPTGDRPAFLVEACADAETPRNIPRAPMIGTRASAMRCARPSARPGWGCR